LTHKSIRAGNQYKRRMQAASVSAAFRIQNQTAVNNQLKTCGRAKKWILEAPTASAMKIADMGRLAPDEIVSLITRENMRAIKSAVTMTTPLSPM